MRQRLLSIAIGLVAGFAGAVVARQWPAASDPTPIAAAATREPSTAPIVPPGWDNRYLGRLAALEDRMRDLDGGATRPEPSAPAASSERAQHRAQLYQKELDHQRSRVDAHATEAIDPGWSRTQTDQLVAGLDAMIARRELVAERVDCRSKTCVATLTFPSPADALGFLASPALRVLGRDLHGLTSTPAPPSHAGAYDLTIVLDR